MDLNRQESSYSNNMQDLDYSSYMIEEEEDDQEVQFLLSKEVFTYLENEINEIKDLLPDYDFDFLLNVKKLYYQYSIKLFYFFSWNKQKLENQYFQDDLRKEFDQKFINAGYFKHEQILTNQNQQYCLICLNEFTPQIVIIKSQCGHLFCQNCWNENLRQKLNENIFYMSCLQEGCNQVQFYSFIESYAQQDLFQKYIMTICKKYIEENKYMCWCLGPDCIYCIRIENKNIQQDVQCKCSFKFCFYCKTEVHKPANCEIAQRWVKEYKENGNSILWISLNTKTCPFCKQQVERSMGCNYLKCRCEKAFCYVCSEPWDPNHKDHFNCPFATKQQENNFKSQKKGQLILKNFNFHFDSFKDQFSAQRATLRELKEIDQYKKILREKLLYTENDCQFLTDSLKELAHCRQVLKWTFCLGYFYFLQDEQKSDQYDLYRQKFKNECDNLEAEISKFFSNCTGIQVQVNDEFNETKIKVELNKKKILTLLRALITFKNSMLEPQQL